MDIEDEGRKALVLWGAQNKERRAGEEYVDENSIVKGFSSNFLKRGRFILEENVPMSLFVLVDDPLRRPKYLGEVILSNVRVVNDGRLGITTTGTYTVI